jgi:DNA (cytosine-5)-methyltransferase 1
MEHKKIKTVDVFSGCGGMSLGFQNAGFDILAAFDNWKFAVQTYKNNFEHAIYEQDIAAEETTELIQKIKPNLIIGGPPCQDFSSAGKQDETLGRADLTITFANLIAQTKPQWFVMENVERIKKSNILQKAIKIIKEAGYGITAQVLDASFCGVPQKRKRFFMIGGLKENDNFLSPYLEKNQAEKPMNVYDYLGNSLDLEYYYRHPRSYKRRGIFSIYEPSPTIRGVNRPIPKNYNLHEGDKVTTLENVRPLTTLERSYIQTFPTSFKFEGAKTNLEQLIGNAVPVKLGEYIAKCLIQYIKDKNKQTTLKKVGQLKMNFGTIS